MRFTTDSKGFNRLNIMCPVQTIHTFNGFCKTVISFAAINAWRDRSRRRQKEISLEHLTEEKFYPLGNGKLAAALLSLPERNRESFSFTFSGITHSRKSGKCTDAAGVRQGIKSAGLYSSCTKKWRCFHMGNPNLLPYETIVRATSGEPEAVD